MKILRAVYSSLGGYTLAIAAFMLLIALAGNANAMGTGFSSEYAQLQNQASLDATAAPVCKRTIEDTLDPTCPITTPGGVIATMVQNMLLDCTAEERANWAVIGSAHFIGEPWVYTWYTTQDWDNASGQWVDIPPIEHKLPVPGESLQVEFEDGTRFTYGEPLTSENRVVWSDNLSTLAKHGMSDMPTPYLASKREDGSIVLLRLKADGSGCEVGWHLRHPD